jgi:hypothetical protein
MNLGLTARIPAILALVAVPACAFERCLKTEETTPLEPGQRSTEP